MDEKDLDQQMGDLDGKDAEKLDEQIWGSDEEEEEEEQKVWGLLLLPYTGLGPFRALKFQSKLLKQLI